VRGTRIIYSSIICSMIQMRNFHRHFLTSSIGYMINTWTHSNLQTIYVSMYKKKMHSTQGCQNGHPTVKFTIQTSARVRIYPINAFLPADGFLPSAPTIKNASARVRVPARTHGRALDTRRADAVIGGVVGVSSI
jgi:hypothetical protein